MTSFMITPSQKTLISYCLQDLKYKQLKGVSSRCINDLNEPGVNFINFFTNAFFIQTSFKQLHVSRKKLPKSTFIRKIREFNIDEIDGRSNFLWWFDFSLEPIFTPTSTALKIMLASKVVKRDPNLISALSPRFSLIST